MQRPSAGRLRSLDALRGLAAISVVLFHYTWGFDHSVQAHVPPLPFGAIYGHLGVQLFFVISGFVILRTLERSTGLLDFAVSRFARLYPAFIAATIITLIIMHFTGFNPRHIGSSDIASSAFMASDLLGRKFVDPSYWTLGFEVVFYALAGLTYLGLGVRRIKLACLVWLAFGVAGVSVSAHHFRMTLLTEGSWSFLFVLGMMVHLIAQGRATLITWITVAASLAMAAYAGGQAPSNLSGPLSAAVSLAFTLVVWAAAEGWLRIDFLPLLFLGDISYSLYLVHQVPGLAALRVLEGAGLSSGAAIVATVLSAIVIATVLRYGVELPSQRWIKAYWRAREDRIVQA